MMTIKIAIVDDIYEDKRIVKEYLNAYLKTKKVNFIIDEFSSGEAFLGKYTSNRYNIVFMDIFMVKSTVLKQHQSFMKMTLPVK